MSSCKNQTAGKLIEKKDTVTVTNLLIEPYHHQVTTLEIIEFRGVSLSPLMGSQGNLQQLKVYEAGRQVNQRHL